MATARIFKSGNSQAVRLPKEFRFDSEEVEIFRRGDEVVLREKVAGDGTRVLAHCQSGHRLAMRSKRLQEGAVRRSATL